MQIKHKWFATLEWDALLAGQVTPPIVPVLKAADDTAYFNAGHDSQEDEVSPYPQWTPNLNPIF